MAQERNSAGLQILVAVIAAAAVVAAAFIGNWQEIFGENSTSPVTTAGPDPTVIVTTAAEPNPSVGTTTSVGAASASEDECRITIANPLTVIREEPDVFAQEAGSVPAGAYSVLEVSNVSFGSQQQRWFRIDVDGRSGWIRDSSFDVESKTAACP